VEENPVQSTLRPEEVAASVQVVGVIGVGLMGLGMTKRLLAQGYTVLTYDVDLHRQNLAAAAGASPVESPAHIAQAAHAIIIAVLDAKQISQVLRGTSEGAASTTTESSLLEGLASHLNACRERNPLVLMCSTVAPADVINFSRQLTAVGAQPIDAPISGGPAKAEAGTMSMMLAASSSALRQVRQLTEDLSARQFVVSEQVGDAMRAKLVNNLMAAANLTAAAEAMGLASAMGLDLHVMAKIASTSSGQSWICDDRFTRVLEGDVVPRAQLHVLTKDVNLATQAALDLHVALPMGQHAAKTMRDACDSGLHYDDDSAMFNYWLRCIQS
jgi:L-threonate 2-dehydrogenase